MSLTVELLPGERWWGGCIDDGHRMPFCSGFERDLLEQRGNQVQPLLVSNRGRWVWSEEPFRFRFDDAALNVESGGPVALGAGRSPTLRGAVREAAAVRFPPSGRIPDPMLFTHPQYNTWIELQYEQTQDGILAYARRLLDEGYPPGVLMIDDSWQRGFGEWRFDPGRFPDPGFLVAELHRLGFKVMLWVCPQVDPCGRTFLDARGDGLLVAGADGKPAIREWWNGHSAILDMTNPRSAEWLRSQLADLQARFGVDGFKFDAGDFSHYRSDDRTVRPGHGGIQSEAWARFSEGWALNELRASWKMGNRPLAQRLRDKAHCWGPEGLASCLPNVLAMSLVGYPFSCPDMIGGGEYRHFNASAESLDGELFVRHAQLAALLPMQQFSAAPWRLLSKEQNRLCREAALLHVEYGDRILSLAREAASTGDPIVRPLAWAWDDERAAGVADEFLLGDGILVAPVLLKGAVSRTVLLPPGRWSAASGEVYAGPAEIEVEAPLDVLPLFVRE